MRTESTALFLILLSIAAASPAFAQHPTDKGPFTQSLIRPQVSYVTHARLKLDSALVRATMEFDYRIQSQSRELRLQFPGGGRQGKAVGSIDSLLLNGVPAPGIRNDTSRDLSVPLPSDLGSQSTVHVLLSYTCPAQVRQSRKTGLTIYCLDNWYPRIPVEAARAVSFRDRGLFALALAEPAEYAVSLTVDSGWIAAANGELLNEKEVLGVLPRDRDTIAVDALHHLEREGGILLGSTPEQSSVRTWEWQSEHASNFSIVVAKGWALDRIVSDNTVVDLFYRSGSSPDERIDQARETQSLIQIYDSLTNAHPFVQSSIVDDPLIGPSGTSSDGILLPSNYLGDNSRRVALAAKLAQCWVRPILSDSEATESPLTGGVRNFLAITALHLVDKSGGYDAYASYAEEELNSMGGSYAPLFHRPFGFLDNVRQPRVYSRKDSVLFEEWYAVPAQLEILRHQLGDSLFWAEWAGAFAPANSGYLSASNLRAKLSDSIRHTKWFSENDIRLSDIDQRLDDVKARSSDSGVVVTGVVVEDSLLMAPITLAYVINSEDTVFQHVDPDSSKDHSRISFSFRLKSSPRAVILDPRYDFPDAQRFNNYFFFELSSGYRESRSQVFPGYRRLRLVPRATL